MKIKVFYPNEKGHIELTKEKLEGLLNEAYNEGYRDGRNNNGYYCGITTTPYVSSISDSNIAYLSSTTPSLSASRTVASSVIDDCCDKAVSAINCRVDTNNGITADILEGKIKNAASSAISCCGKITSTTDDCVNTTTIDNYINTNDEITADILEGKVKNAIIVEYAEAANEA